MPIVNITLIEGRDKAKKIALIKSVTDAVEHSIDAPRQSIRVIINEVSALHFGVAGIPKSEIT